MSTLTSFGYVYEFCKSRVFVRILKDKQLNHVRRLSKIKYEECIDMDMYNNHYIVSEGVIALMVLVYFTYLQLLVL